MKRWDRKPCGCIRADLPQSGKVLIACSRHRHKKTKRQIAHFDENGIVRLGA